MKQFRVHRLRKTALSLSAAAIALFAPSFSQAQNNIFPPAGSAGIGTMNPGAMFEIHASDIFPNQRASTLYTHDVDFGGEIGIARIDAVPSTLVKRGDYFLRTTSRSNHLLVTNQTANGQIRFGTTVSVGSLMLERESFSISAVQDATSQNGHTQLDVKTMMLNEGNAVLRFYNSPNAMAGDKGPWMIGTDAHHSFTTSHQLPPEPVFRIGINSAPASPTFSNSTYNYLTILRDGRVIVGKPLASSSGLFDSKLSVDGRIVANELVCVGIENWADFVFADNYKLLTLDEVEQHIQQHRHLPDIPSASDVQQKGVNIVEMQTKLLQKVEELTLYVIDQNKQIADQNKRLIEQSGRIQSLEAELLQARQQAQTQGNVK